MVRQWQTFHKERFLPLEGPTPILSIGEHGSPLKKASKVEDVKGLEWL